MELPALNTSLFGLKNFGERTLPEIQAIYCAAYDLPDCRNLSVLDWLTKRRWVGDKEGLGDEDTPAADLFRQMLADASDTERKYRLKIEILYKPRTLTISSYGRRPRVFEYSPSLWIGRTSDVVGQKVVLIPVAYSRHKPLLWRDVPEKYESMGPIRALNDANKPCNEEYLRGDFFDEDEC